jgi:hypothetical protein
VEAAGSSVADGPSEGVAGLNNTWVCLTRQDEQYVVWLQDREAAEPVGSALWPGKHL